MENYDHSPISHVRDAMRCDAMRCMNGKRRVQADAASVLGSYQENQSPINKRKTISVRFELAKVGHIAFVLFTMQHRIALPKSIAFRDVFRK